MNTERMCEGQKEQRNRTGSLRLSVFLTLFLLTFSAILLTVSSLMTVEALSPPPLRGTISGKEMFI